MSSRTPELAGTLNRGRGRRDGTGVELPEDDGRRAAPDTRELDREGGGWGRPEGGRGGAGRRSSTRGRRHRCQPDPTRSGLSGGGESPAKAAVRQAFFLGTSRRGRISRMCGPPGLRISRQRRKGPDGPRQSSRWRRSPDGRARTGGLRQAGTGSIEGPRGQLGRRPGLRGGSTGRDLQPCHEGGCADGPGAGDTAPPPKRPSCPTPLGALGHFARAPGETGRI